MKLNELAVGDNVILQVEINGQFAEFPTTVTDVKSENVLLDVIRVNEKIVGFSSEHVVIDLINIRPEKPPMVWKRVSCITVSQQGKTQYQIAASGEGFESNRREAFRLFVGISGIAQVGLNKKALDVIVKDVSENGFSFVSEINLEDAYNKPVRLVFEDMERNYSLMGIVVRQVVIAENKVLYGCKMSVDNFEIVRYINFKQRQQLQMHSENAAARNIAKLQAALAEGDIAKNCAVNKMNSTKDSKHYVGNNTDGRRKINTVQKDERREVFRDIHSGKKH